MAEKKKTKELFKDYVPEIMYYDPEVDGGSEHLIREEHLDEKERLKKAITKRKEAHRANRKLRR